MGFLTLDLCSIPCVETMARGSPGAYIFGCARQPACAGGRLVATACSDARLRLWAIGADGRLSFLHEVGFHVSGATSEAASRRWIWELYGLCTHVLVWHERMHVSIRRPPCAVDRHTE